MKNPKNKKIKLAVIYELDKFDIDIPLVVDLDECLLKTDFLYESFFSFVKQNPFRVFKAFGWFLKGGKTHLKQELAKRVKYDVNLYPQNEELVALAKSEVKKGRKVHLATASSELFVKYVAKRFDFISDVHASDEKINLRGKAKANRLQTTYPDGFIYAGDSVVDIAVWKKAKGIVLVGAKKSTIAKISKEREPDIIIEKQKSIFKIIAKALRIHQWAKNALVFVPLFLSGAFLAPNSWVFAGIGFLAMSLLASATYVINDLWDLSDDRAHWSKRFRPLASGDLSLPNGIGLALISFAGAGILALFLPVLAQVLLAIYLATTLLYSFYLKREPIIDVVTIASLFSLRVAFGAEAIEVAQSSWLLVFAMALFLSLSFAKRVVEVQKLGESKKATAFGRGYKAEDANILMIFGAASGMSAVIVMVMYIFNDAFNAQFYSAPILLWAFPVILLIWISHIWLVCSRGQLNDDPVIFALKDKKSLSLAGILALSFAVSWSVVPILSTLGF